jgi:hypothetical protein
VAGAVGSQAPREFMIAPFILVTRIEADAVEILRIYHSAQDWP